MYNWNGVNGSRTFKQAVDHLYNSSLETVGFTITENVTKEKSVGHISERFYIPYGKCKVFEGKPKRQFSVCVNTTQKNIKYNVLVTDSEASTAFQLPHSLIKGDPIEITTSSVKKLIQYTVQFKETNIVVNDGTCTIYPSREHDTYANCVVMK